MALPRRRLHHVLARRPLKQPPDLTIGRDATVGVGHLRDEKVDEDDGGNEEVDPQQHGSEGAGGLVPPLERDVEVAGAGAEAAENPPEGPARCNALYVSKISRAMPMQ